MAERGESEESIGEDGETLPAGKGELASARASASADVVVFALVLLLLALSAWLGLAWTGNFYADPDIGKPLFAWSAFVFFMTKGIAAKIAGASLFGAIGFIVFSASKAFRSRRAVRLVTGGSALGILLTILLWITISQDQNTFGEITAMAGDSFPSDLTARVDAAEAAIDSLLGSLLAWWIWMIASLLGLKVAENKGWMHKFRGFFTAGG